MVEKVKKDVLRETRKWKEAEDKRITELEKKMDELEKGLEETDRGKRNGHGGRKHEREKREK